MTAAIFHLSANPVEAHKTLAGELAGPKESPNKTAGTTPVVRDDMTLELFPEQHHA